MEAVEFIRTIQKMCAGTDCDVCPLNEKNGCNVCYAEDPVGSVRIVEEWAAEQEREKAEQENKKAEQDKRLQEIEGKIRILWEKTQMMDEASEMQTKSIDALREMIEKARNTIRMDNVIMQRFMESESDERAKIEKRLTERIKKLEKGEH